MIARSTELLSGPLHPIVKFKLPSRRILPQFSSFGYSETDIALDFLLLRGSWRRRCPLRWHQRWPLRRERRAGHQLGRPAGEFLDSPINYILHYTENHVTRSDRCISRLEFNVLFSCLAAQRIMPNDCEYGIVMHFASKRIQMNAPNLLQQFVQVSRFAAGIKHI